MLTVRNLMSPKPETVKRDTLLRTVIDLMKVSCCRQLPVVDDTGRVLGIVTDRDLRLAVQSPLIMRDSWQEETLLNKVTAENCMTPNPITVRSDLPAYRAAEILGTYKFGALPVIDDGELVGIITVTDFLDRFAAQQPNTKAIA